MLAFYKTEAAQKMLLDPKNLSIEQEEEIYMFFESEIGIIIAEKHELLSKDISQISEYWSRDLYRETMEKIMEKASDTKN